MIGRTSSSSNVSNVGGPGTEAPWTSVTAEVDDGSSESARIPVAAAAGEHRLAEQAEEGDALLLGNQVGAVEDRVGEPGEQLDQRAAGVACLRRRPFRRMRRDAGEHLLYEVVVGAIVESRWYQWHSVTQLAWSRRSAWTHWFAIRDSGFGRWISVAGAVNRRDIDRVHRDAVLVLSEALSRSSSESCRRIATVLPSSRKFCRPAPKNGVISCSPGRVVRMMRMESRTLCSSLRIAHHCPPTGTGRNGQPMGSR